MDPQPGDTAALAIDRFWALCRELGGIRAGYGQIGSKLLPWSCCRRFGSSSLNRVAVIVGRYRGSETTLNLVRSFCKRLGVNWVRELGTALLSRRNVRHGWKTVSVWMRRCWYSQVAVGDSLLKFSPDFRLQANLSGTKPLGTVTLPPKSNDADLHLLLTNLSRLHDLSQVHTLTLAFSEVTDRSIESITQLKGLKKLNLWSTKVGYSLSSTGPSRPCPIIRSRPR